VAGISALFRRWEIGSLTVIHKRGGLQRGPGSDSLKGPNFSSLEWLQTQDSTYYSQGTPESPE
jgi:hypothetical protein